MCRFRIESVNVFVLPRFDLCHVLSSSTNNFAHAQTLYRMSSLCRSYECMNIARVNIGFFTGFKTIKQRRISFILGYLRMILWKISTAISIKHRILATFNIKKNSILTACMPLIEMLVSFFFNERISINKFFTSDFGDLFYRSNPFNHSEHNYRQYVFNKSGFKIQLKSD